MLTDKELAAVPEELLEDLLRYFPRDYEDRRRFSTVAAALQKIATRQAAGEAITGPKKIGCYGASY